MDVNTWLALAVWTPMFVVPLLLALVDIVPSICANQKSHVKASVDSPTNFDFSILVPIYGNAKYLLNVDFLAEHRDRVVLCTTDQESEEFCADLERIAERYGFGIHYAPTESTAGESGKRSTSGTVRDQVVRDAVHYVSTKYVICLDADSEPQLPFEVLAGEMEAHDMEVASVSLVPTNTGRLLGKLQQIEYRLAMRQRRLAPWLVSGGCHAATTEAYRDIMERHSMFFQGNDIEVGLLGDQLGFRCGHVMFPVGTDVPDTFKNWSRQRYAWAGGEWRLGITNIKYASQHPFFYTYLTLITLMLAPLRWYVAITTPFALVIVYLIYLVLILWLNRKTFTFVLFLYPIYSLSVAFFYSPLSVVSYIQMSSAHNNWGRISRTIRDQHVLNILNDSVSPPVQYRTSRPDRREPESTMPV